MDDITPTQASIAALKENITQARLIAAESTTIPEILRELALFDDEKTREAVVSNANTPPEVLVQLGEEFPAQFLDNPVFPLLLLENPNFIRELPLNTLRSILQEKNVPEYILEQAADKAGVGVQLALANNIKTSKSILNRLSKSIYPAIVEAVNLHVNFVGELTGGFEKKVRELVLQSFSLSQRFNYYTLAVLAQIFPIPEFIIEHWAQESRYQDTLCREIADSPATPPLILKRLANYTDSCTQEKIARNISTPVETLRELAEKGIENIKLLVAGNPSTPSDALEYLSRDENELVRLNVAKHPNTSLRVLKKLQKDADEEVVQTAKKVIAERKIAERKDEYPLAPRHNPETPLDILRFFQEIEKYTDVHLKKLVKKHIINIAKHQNTPPEVLLKLSQSSDGKIRQSVATNPNTPVSVIEDLANDEYYKVRLKVAQNPNTPLNILFYKLVRETKIINALASQISPLKSSASIYEPENIIDILAEYSNCCVETIVQEIASRGGQAARLFLARRSDLPADLLAQFAQTSDIKLRKIVARNPNTPIDTLEELMNDKSAEVREQVFQNPGLSKETVERILCSENAFYYLKLNPDYLSRYPDIKASIINYYADVKSPSMWVNYITLIQPEITQDLLHKKSNSVFWIERLAIAKNPKASQDILDKLAEDCNQLVRAAAKDTLQHLVSRSSS